MLDICRPASWRTVARKITSSILSAEVIAKCLETPADEMYADSMSFLEGAIASAGDANFSEVLQRVCDGFSAEFKTIRAFHGCRPISLGPYLARGILPLNSELLADYTFALFEGTIPRVEIDQLVADADLKGRLGIAYFCGNPEAQIAEYGHYLIDGPESLCCLFKESRAYECRERQRRIGVPTMLDCAVPLAMLDSSLRDENARIVITSYFQELSEIPATETYRVDCAVQIRTPLPPRHILGHFHPSEIYDVHGDGSHYVNTLTKCPWC